MKNVIVTGGTGFLGRNMIQRLCSEGYHVYAIVRPESNNKGLLPRHENVIPVYCNLKEIGTNDALIEKQFNAFYHFAWGGVNRDEIDDDAVQRESMKESLKTVEAAIQLNCRCFIFAGSRSEYGRIEGAFQEDAICQPQVAYGQAKLEFGNCARELCHGTGTRYIHTRIFSVYGPGDHPWSLVSTAVKKMRKNEPMELSSCTHLWNYMDVRDMADLLLTFSQNLDKIPENDSGIFNVATDDIRPLRDYVEEIYQITGSRSELRFGSFQQTSESAMSVVPDMQKVQDVFGWKQKISFSEGIRNVIEHMEGQNA